MGRRREARSCETHREREREKERNDMTVTNGDGAMNGVHEKPSTGVKVSKEVEDLLLWEDPIKSGGILGGATVAYLLFHCSGYSALYIVCNLLLVGVVGTFVWSIIAQLLGKPEFPIPEPQPEAIEKAFAAVADKGKTVTNQGIGFFYFFSFISSLRPRIWPVRRAAIKPTFWPGTESRRTVDGCPMCRWLPPP